MVEGEDPDQVPFEDPNKRHLVAEVSRKVCMYRSGRQILLYMMLLDQGRLAAVDRWLHCTMTTIDRFHCT